MMKKYELGEMEEKFADIIWHEQPISSGDLSKICEKELSWKRTTTYTMLKRLCDRGIFKNDGGTVVTVISKEEFKSRQGRDFVKKTFKGSLPQFITSFTRTQKLSPEEISEIQKLIDDYKEDNYDR